MKKNLPFVRSRLVLTLVLLFSLPFFVNAQQLKRSHDQTASKGHELYKHSKIYDNSAEAGNETRPRPVGDRALDRLKFDFERLRNPFTNEIPKNIRELELAFSKSSPVMKSTGKSTWRNRGPYNVGGRTRALAIDRNNENIILAGGVSGGLWKSTDAGQTWTKTTSSRQSPSITCIVQDPRPGKSHVWYYGSGERFGNSASGGGAFFTGSGIYKSSNGGDSWRLLSSTSDNSVTSISPFDIINTIDINPLNGHIYVGTFNGVHRSKDKGRSFEEVLVGGFDNWCEVIVTPSGKIYAAIEFFGTENYGLFVSDDGDNWTRLSDTSPFIFNGRTVMTYDPSDDNIIYFFAENLIGFPYLLRYDAAAAPGSQWTDLSINLPNGIGGNVGSLNLQGRYNMMIKVKPDDPNFIVLGGTNLYRSTTGFTTPAGQESWIGGYSPINNISIYPDQHPDQHNLIFYPSNPNKVLSATDGGVHLTEDITTSLSQFEPVDWISLNNGYLTTQPYAVAFDPEANSDDLVAGFQDNGTWYTNSTNPVTAWTEDFGGDGSFNAIADGGNTRYVSSQFGNIYRLDFDDAGNFISFARIRPAILANPSFINPFVLDVNNDNIMYLPDGNRMLRNSNLDEIPKNTFAFATTNWVALDQTATPDNSVITSLGVSKYPVANRLYYGTATGLIFRMDNANLDNQVVTNISSGKGLPPGYASDINVDPSNSDRVMVSFSNYGIPSVYFTEDGGNTWTNISGTLEENADGSGNGPSVRATAFRGNGKSYYAATSTGLYFANELDGNNTQWAKDPRIGNAVIEQVKTRKDGFVALAAHGNGLISAKFPLSPSFEIPENTLSVAYLLDDFVVELNSDDTDIDITGLFVSSNSGAIDIALTNSNPGLVTASISGNTLTLSYATGQSGNATIGLIATKDGETVAEGFTVTVVETPIYEQIDAPVSSAPSQNFLDFGGLVQSADDFVVPAGNMWTINRVLAFGAANGSPILDNATVVIYEDDGGVPGAEVYNSGLVTPASATNDTNLNIPLPAPVELSSGNYWLVVYSSFAFSGGNQWFWRTQATVNGSESHLKDDANLFGAGATDWTPTSVAFNRVPADQIFQLFGVAVDEASTGSNLTETNLVSLDARMQPVAWPNPSAERFNFNLSSFGNAKVSIRIHDLAGRIVYKNNDLSAIRGEFSWDASRVPSGMYIAVIQGGSIRYSGKLIKQ
ncbi:MAG: T9SS type A sorting domain-containing protein [Flavobacteriaceae bacterium]|nr:T9SS type A sorting domain-containing protein [Flavobacteriaceae bacterium]